MLAAPKNTALKVNANGKDESQAMDAIESLFINKFDEE